MSQQTLVRARTVRHIRIDSGRPYARFRTDYETVVPSFDREGGEDSARLGVTLLPLALHGSVGRDDNKAARTTLCVQSDHPSPPQPGTPVGKIRDETHTRRWASR
jgi:hypothetical protein